MGLEGESNHNTIGPNNIIAYSGYAGVAIMGPKVLSNTISQNSIYDNNKLGIYLQDGGNYELSPPRIYAVIGIGAALIVVVIVLIVRIRRP